MSHFDTLGTIRKPEVFWHFSRGMEMVWYFLVCWQFPLRLFTLAWYYFWDFIFCRFVDRMWVWYKLGVLGHFPPRDTFWSGGIQTFCPKKSQERLIKFIKIFELYQVFMHNFCVKIFEYSQIAYWLHKKSTHFVLEVSVVYVISSPYVLNCLKYFLMSFGTKCLRKSDKKNFKLYLVFMC